jgi:demethylmenaquinone methyltransferase/2-methoxy-6-polyprenyl-1,4-benzoquinol methylase
VDALALPYEDSSVDRVICAFLLRNLDDYQPALKEILRVLKPDGIFVSLDTTPPALAILRPIIRLYMRLAIPLVGALVTGRFSAYDYLIRSTEGFTPAPLLVDHLLQAGFNKAEYRLMLFGTAAIHKAVKKEDSL